MRKRTEKQVALGALFQTIANNDAFFNQMKLPEIRSVCQGNMKGTIHMAQLFDEMIEEMDHLRAQNHDLNERLKKLEESCPKTEESPSPRSTE